VPPIIIISDALYRFHTDRQLLNERKKLSAIIRWLKEEKTISLISDAGMPTLQDPGAILIQEAIAHDIPISVIPGPSSVIQAYVSSGLFHSSFQFRGFLPKKEGKRKKELLCILDYEGTSIVFESPHRLVKTLLQLSILAPKASVAVCRELTKKFETIQRGSSSELALFYEQNPPKGECTLVIEGLVE
jgi:16S rRNA (cytidine1402-2'-O)-methyltransferase